MLIPYLHVTITRHEFEPSYLNPRSDPLVVVEIRDEKGVVHTDEQIILEDHLVSYFDRVWESTGRRIKQYLISSGSSIEAK